MSWADVDMAINECIEAYVATKVAARLALFHAQEAQKQRDECQDYAEKLQKKALLFKRDTEGER